jgi:type I restriction enzyme S subunit
MFPAYSVMMTSRATIGVTAINTRPACTNQGFVICVPNERVSFHQLYFWIEENKEKIISVASGATYKEISRSEFREFPIAVADKDKNLLFVEILTPIAKQIENLLAKNTNLCRTHDLLLPKLISGEVNVNELDIDEGKRVA